LVKAPFASGADVLRLPTTSELEAVPPVVGLLPTTIRLASLTTDVVTIVIDDPAVEPGHVFLVGDEITVSGIEFGADTNPNGTFILTSVTDNGSTISLTYDLVGANATYTLPVALPQVLPFALNDIQGSAVIGYNMLLDQEGISGVYASTAYSNPNDSASQWVLLGSNVSALAINLADPTITYNLPYKEGETAPVLSDMIQAFNKVFLFRDGQTALEWDGSFLPVAVTDLVVDGTYSITDLGDTTQLQWNTIAGTSGVTYAVNDTITVDAVGTGTGTARSGFTPVKSGQYTQPVQIDCLPGEFAITNSIASVSGSHDVKVGDDITVMSASISGVPEADSGLSIGQDYVVNKVYKLGDGVANITGVTDSEFQNSGDFEGFYKYTIKSAAVDAARASLSAAYGNLIPERAKRVEILQREDPDGDEVQLRWEEIERIVPAIKMNRNIRALLKMAEEGDKDAELEAEIASNFMGLTLKQMMAGEMAPPKPEPEDEPTQVLSLFGGGAGRATPTKRPEEGGE